MADILAYGMILFDSIDNKYHIGGPSLNVATHIVRHGFNPTFISAIGDDELGDMALEFIENEGISQRYIYKNGHPTGRSIVAVNENGAPSFDIKREVAYEYIDLSDEIIKELSVRDYDLIYFGTVEQQGEVSLNTLKRLLKNINYKKAYYDINLRKGHYTRKLVEELLSFADILKLNDEEVILINELFEFNLDSEKQIVKRLFEAFNFDIIIITRGGNGASAYTQENKYNVNGIEVEVKDTIGAGDAFSAAFITEYVKSGDIKNALEKGNGLGAYVASCVGAVPDYKRG